MNEPVPPRAIHILLVEDSADDAELLRAALRKSGLAASISVVDAEADFLLQLGRQRPSVVVCDYHLPHFSCARVLEILGTGDSAIPVVLVSRGVEAKDAAEMLRRGARAYVRKDRLAELAAAIGRALAVPRHA